MIRAAALLLSAAALAPLPALAQSTAITATVDPARRALGFELAKLLNPEEPTMAALDKVFGEQLPASMLANPEMKQLEDQYPGILSAMADAMKPILLRYMRSELPTLWDQMAVIFASEMNEAELRATIAFYRGPTGARIIELMITEADMGPMLGRMMAKDFEVTEQDLSGGISAMAGDALGRMTPEQHADMMRFMATPAGQRLTRIFPRLVKLVAEWSSEPAPGIEAEIEAAILPVVERYTGIKLK